MVVVLVMASGVPALAGCPSHDGRFAKINDGGTLLESFDGSPASEALTTLLDAANSGLEMRPTQAEVLVASTGERALQIPVYAGEARVGSILYVSQGRAAGQVQTPKGMYMVYADAEGNSRAQYVGGTVVSPTEVISCMDACQLSCGAVGCTLYCSAAGLGVFCAILCAGACNMVCGCICYGCVCCGGVYIPPRANVPGV